MTGTSVESVSKQLADIIVKAAIHVAEQNDDYTSVNIEQVRMAKKGIGSLSETKLIEGIIIDKNLDLERLPRNLTAGKVVVFSCPLEIEKSSYDSEIEISSTEQWVSFMDAEEAILETKAQSIITVSYTHLTLPTIYSV